MIYFFYVYFQLLPASLLLLMSAAAVNSTSVEELRAVSHESCITPIMNPTPTTCIAMSLGIPKSEHARGMSRRLPPATPDAPHALMAETMQSRRAVPKSTSISRKLVAARVRTEMVTAAPSMFMVTVDLPCDGSIQITASHHPWDRNGLKFFTREGGLDAPDIDNLLARCESNTLPGPAAVAGAVTPTDYMTQYAAHLRELIQKGVNAPDYDHPLEGFHIVVDAGNGAGGFYAWDVLEPLGADISGSQFLEPDGMFPLGVIFDTDVDRGGAVDARGQEINRNRLVALASAIALEGNPGGTVVTDSITSDGLKDYLENTLGGHHHRFKRGYKNVINEALRLNEEGVNCPLAIETSGHAAMRENYFLDDGAYLVTKIIIKMAQLRREGKDLDSLLAPLAEPAEAAEVRLPILEEDFRACGNQVIAQLEGYAREQGWQIAPDNREGLRVSFPQGEGDGWFLLRLSVHDPIMPLNMESNVAGGVKVIAQKLQAFLLTCKGLDHQPMADFLAK